MNEQNPQKNEGGYLNIVIECLKDRNFYGFKKEQPDDIPTLFNNTKKLLTNFDNSITRCKRYHQAKIHRKYQIRINDLEKQIEKLKVYEKYDKNQFHVINELVHERNKNQQLKKQIQNLQQRIQLLHKKHEYDKQIKDEVIQKNSNNFELKGLILIEVQNYLQKIKKKQISEFQIYLKKHLHNMKQWNIQNLIENIDRWSQRILKKQNLQLFLIKNKLSRNLTSCKNQRNYNQEQIKIINSAFRQSKSQLYQIRTPIENKRRDSRINSINRKNNLKIFINQFQK